MPKYALALADERTWIVSGCVVITGGGACDTSKGTALERARLCMLGFRWVMGH